MIDALPRNAGTVTLLGGLGWWVLAPLFASTGSRNGHVPLPTLTVEPDGSHVERVKGGQSVGLPARLLNIESGFVSGYPWLSKRL